MPRVKKSELELKPDEDGTLVVPIESVQQKLPTVSPTELNKKIKRPLTDRQAEVVKNMTEALAKKRADPEWQAEQQRKKEARARAKEEALIQKAEELKKLKREEDEKKIQAGTHIRIKVNAQPTKSKTKPKPKPKPVESDFTATETEADSDDEDTDTDMEEYKSKKRVVRREVKKNLKALEKIQEVEKFVAPTVAIQQNPYMAMLMNKWR